MKNEATNKTEATNKREVPTDLTTLAKETLLEIRTIVNDVQISKSEKIRRLNEKQLTKGVIAKLLQVKYQFVYQVLTRATNESDATKKMSATEMLDFLNNIE